MDVERTLRELYQREKDRLDASDLESGEARRGRIRTNSTAATRGRKQYERGGADRAVSERMKRYWEARRAQIASARCGRQCGRRCTGH